MIFLSAMSNLSNAGMMREGGERLCPTEKLPNLYNLTPRLNIQLLNKGPTTFSLKTSKYGPRNKNDDLKIMLSDLWIFFSYNLYFLNVNIEYHVKQGCIQAEGRLWGHALPPSSLFCKLGTGPPITHQGGGQPKFEVPTFNI